MNLVKQWQLILPLPLMSESELRDSSTGRTISRRRATNYECLVQARCRHGSLCDEPRNRNGQIGPRQLAKDCSLSVELRLSDRLLYRTWDIFAWKLQLTEVGRRITNFARGTHKNPQPPLRREGGAKSESESLRLNTRTCSRACV